MLQFKSTQFVVLCSPSQEPTVFRGLQNYEPRARDVICPLSLELDNNSVFTPYITLFISDSCTPHVGLVIICNKMIIA